MATIAIRVLIVCVYCVYLLILRSVIYYCAPYDKFGQLLEHSSHVILLRI